MEKLQPERLYHYTTVESLALILKNKTLRLNPLNKMDDLQEAQSDTVQNYGQCVFVSSWTDMKEESIPMWKMYSSMDAGVRISMAPDPFQIFDLTTNSFRDPTDEEWQNRQMSKAFYPVIDIPESVKHYICPNSILGKQLCEVEYTDDPSKLVPSIEQIEGGKCHVDIGKMGRYKHKQWSFQREYRYKLITTPFSLPVSIDAWNLVVSAMVQYGGMKSPVDYIDLHLAENKLSDMVITTSPCISEANRIIIESLVQSYCPNAKIEKSALAGLVR